MVAHADAQFQELAVQRLVVAQEVEYCFAAVEVVRPAGIEERLVCQAQEELRRRVDRSRVGVRGEREVMGQHDKRP